MSTDSPATEATVLTRKPGCARCGYAAAGYDADGFYACGVRHNVVTPFRLDTANLTRNLGSRKPGNRRAIAEAFVDRQVEVVEGRWADQTSKWTGTVLSVAAVFAGASAADVLVIRRGERSDLALSLASVRSIRTTEHEEV